MAKEEDSNVQIYAIARAAEWAGDLDFSRAMYAEFSRQGQYPLFPERFDGPLDVIRFVSALRAGRLNEPSTSDETKSLAMQVFSVERVNEKAIAAPEAKPLRPTTHLRGVVHRTGERDFEMRAYITSAAFERRLYSNARKLGAKAETEREPKQPQSTLSPYGPPGGSWVIEGILFQQVTVSDLGLIKSRGRWTRNELPRDAANILNTFEKLLDALDPSEAAVSTQSSQ